jgi:hypothetical protein
MNDIANEMDLMPRRKDRSSFPRRQPIRARGGSFRIIELRPVTGDSRLAQRR